MRDHINILESNHDEETGGSKDHQKLGSIKGQMKALFAKEDYQSSVQMHFFDILHQQDKQEEAARAATCSTANSHEESELVSLSLGISSSKGPSTTMDDDQKNAKIREEINLDNELGHALGLDFRFEPSSSAQLAAEATDQSPKGSFDDEQGGKEEKLIEKWPPSKVLKTASAIGDGDTSSQLKKPRVSIRARCDTQTMNDGCQWRKYGQKRAKGNPCPRSYYRCTVSPSCPVRKQVQRCYEDISILITTYEGTHNHPLTSSATAMASTTSAAASMLQSSSLISQEGLANSSDPVPIINPSVAYNLNALNFTSSCQQFSRTQQLYFPYSSSISTYNSHPTITLDLTNAPPTTSSSFGKFFPSSFSSMSSTNLNFTSTTFSPLQSSVIDSTWINPYSGNCFNHGGTITQNRNQNGSQMNTGKQPFQGHHQYQPNYMSNHAISQFPLPDFIARANPLRENHVVAESAALNLKLGEDMSCMKNTVYISSQNAQHQGNITFPQPQPPKSSYGSPSKNTNYQFLQQRK